MVFGILNEPPHLEIIPLYYLANRKWLSIFGENMLKYTVKWKTYRYPVFKCLLGSLKSIHFSTKLLFGLELGPFGKAYKSIHLWEATGFPGRWVNQTRSNHRMLGSEVREALSTSYFACEKTGIPEVDGLAQATHVRGKAVSIRMAPPDLI